MSRRRRFRLGAWFTCGLWLCCACAHRGGAVTSGSAERQPVAGASRSAGQAPSPLSAIAEGALLLDGLGAGHRTVTTSSPQAQAFFDQGLRLTWAFNHDEAARSFARAAQLDPSCASCFWGVALVLGPNYNVPMLPDRAAAAWSALQSSRALASAASPVEQALIRALSQRYRGPEPRSPAEQAPLSQSYAAAMREVARQFPDDFDVQVLFAESLMDLRPWKLWTRDQQPAEGTEEIVRTLEGVLAKVSDHLGANHYYLHAVEASPSPQRALASAQRLPALAPAAGHVVHMPAHIYQRVGRYSDAAAANRAAIAADRAYIERARPTGYYPMYLAHNHGFLSIAASMMGRSQECIGAAKQSAEAMPAAMLDMMPGMDFFVTAPLFAQVRFGRWQALLEEPAPEQRYPVLTGLWRHARAMALASTGRIPEAKVEAEALEKLIDTLPDDLRASNNNAKQLLTVALRSAEARIAERKRSPQAIALWRQAVALEDQLDYAEPADWFFPLRHFLGAALLDTKQPVEAEAVYRADLRDHPDNGWALFGLWKSLSAQRKTRQAAEAKRSFEQAWRQADTPLTRTAL